MPRKKQTAFLGVVVRLARVREEGVRGGEEEEGGEEGHTADDHEGRKRVRPPVVARPRRLGPVYPLGRHLFCRLSGLVLEAWSLRVVVGFGGSEASRCILRRKARPPPEWRGWGSLLSATVQCYTSSSPLVHFFAAPGRLNRTKIRVCKKD